MEFYNNPDRSIWETLVKRPDFNHKEIKKTVIDILTDVGANGDEALLRLTEKLDGWKPGNILVTEEEMRNAEKEVGEDLKKAIRIAKANIEKFHAAQTEKINVIETMPGINCWRKPVPVESVGLYIPGGTASLFSTLLMLGIPARLAGCKKIVVCSPVKSGTVQPVLLYTASLLGIKEFYKAGGAQAIAAMAYGTTEIPKVEKIFGPGNRYVTVAKQLVNREGVAIDMPAGPSEVAIFADDTAKISFVAADLLSQAEHGKDSQVMLVTTDENIWNGVENEINRQIRLLDRKAEIESSMKNSKCVLLKNEKDSFDLLNQYAPEHLIIASDNSDELSGRVVNAGSVFLGHYSPESAGDYISGTNHTLPTNGYAKTYSGVSLDNFVKKITFQKLTPEGLKSVCRDISTMALAEGLKAHAHAASIRFEKEN
ncbi:MAG: histidinol dehydrogenase [Chitinophagaceae bacterium]|nr:histidinol dehydrogenase [Chitinophagaceae bacterium]